MQNPKAKSTFLQKNAFSCKKRHFPAENAVFGQEIARGLQGSRIKNTNQLSLADDYHPRKYYLINSTNISVGNKSVMMKGINYLRIFSVIITAWETNFTDLQANDFGNLGKIILETF